MSTSSQPSDKPRPIRALLIDVFGTCANPQVGIVESLLGNTPASAVSASTFSDQQKQDGEWARAFGLYVRAAFFKLASEVTANGQAVSRREYEIIVQQAMEDFKIESEEEDDWKDRIVTDIFEGPKTEAWKDASLGLKMLRSKFILIGISNAPTSFVIKTTRQDDLTFDTVLCADVTRAFKPDPRVYQIPIQTLKAGSNPEEIAMVAAHPYELEAARKYGLRTIFISRAKDDSEEELKKEFDMVVMDGGYVELAKRLGCGA